MAKVGCITAQMNERWSQLLRLLIVAGADLVPLKPWCGLLSSTITLQELGVYPEGLYHHRCVQEGDPPFQPSAHLEAVWFNPHRYVLCITSFILGLQGKGTLVVIFAIWILFSI